MLPKGYKIVVASSGSTGAYKGGSFVFVDIDSVGAEQIRKHASKTFVIAVAQEERTGPVMEATTFRAYEIMHQPLKKEWIEKVLTEVDKHLLEYFFAHAREKQSEAARLLGINRLTLRKKLELSR